MDPFLTEVIGLDAAWKHSCGKEMEGKCAGGREDSGKRFLH